MTSQTVYIIVRGQGESGRIPVKRLLQTDLERIGQGFYVANGSKTESLHTLLPADSVFLFKRTRNLIKPLINPSQDSYLLGSLVIIAYKRIPKDPKVRKRLQRLLFKAPCFRLRKGTYAFIQLKPSVYRRFRNIVSPSKFVNEIRKQGGEVTVVSRVALENKRLSMKLLQEFKSLILGRIDLISEKSKSMMGQLRGGEYSEENMKKELSSIRKKLILMKRLMHFVSRIMNMNLSKEYTKALNSYMRCRQAFREMLVIPL
ncbi:MAG: hypothetical protein ACFFBS_08425 [Promethearchaeota archaeon]